MIIVDGEEFESHTEYFEKYGWWKRKEFEKVNRYYLLKKYDVPCPDCGLRWHPAAMTLDHIKRDGYKNSEGKRKSPAEMIGYPPVTFNEEIKKCEAVCSNCHKIREMIRDGHINNTHWEPWADIPLQGALIRENYIASQTS